MVEALSSVDVAALAEAHKTLVVVAVPSNVLAAAVAALRAVKAVTTTTAAHKTSAVGVVGDDSAGRITTSRSAIAMRAST